MGRVGSKTLFQRNPQIYNWGSRLTCIEQHNGHKTVVCVHLLRA